MPPDWLRVTRGPSDSATVVDVVVDGTVVVVVVDADVVVVEREVCPVVPVVWGEPFE